MTKISESDLAEVIRDARQKRGGKAAKYIALDMYRESIVELMKNDIQLTFILRWLIEKNGEKLVLNTLRKYIVKYIGREAYDGYLERNGWKKTKRTQQVSASPPQPRTESPDRQDSNAGLGFDLNISTPAKFERTKR